MHRTAQTAFADGSMRDNAVFRAAAISNAAACNVSGSLPDYEPLHHSQRDRRGARHTAGGCGYEDRIRPCGSSRRWIDLLRRGSPACCPTTSSQARGHHQQRGQQKLRSEAAHRVIEIRSPSHITPNTATIKYSEGKPSRNPRGNSQEGANECAVVEIESVTLIGVLPGVIVAEGENVAVAPAGSPEAVNVTGLENAPFTAKLSD